MAWVTDNPSLTAFLHGLHVSPSFFDSPRDTSKLQTSSRGWLNMLKLVIWTTVQFLLRETTECHILWRTSVPIRSSTDLIVEGKFMLHHMCALPEPESVNVFFQRVKWSLSRISWYNLIFSLHVRLTSRLWWILYSAKLERQEEILGN